MSEEASRPHLPPFVVADPETGAFQIEIKDLPEELAEAIRKDNSLDEEGPREWYSLRQGITALRFVEREVADGGAKEAQERLGQPWLKDMPADWDEYVKIHLSNRH